MNFYLADFRFADNSQDYIVNDWRYVDFSPLGSVDEIRFSMSSSDNDAFGPLTPTYFAMDNFLAVPEPSSLAASLSPDSACCFAENVEIAMQTMHPTRSAEWPPISCGMALCGARAHRSRRPYSAALERSGESLMTRRSRASSGRMASARRGWTPSPSMTMASPSIRIPAIS